MNKGMAALILGQMIARSGFAEWREDGLIVEKTNLPKKEAMPLTDDEKETLSQLSGKEKKRFVKELKERYAR